MTRRGLLFYAVLGLMTSSADCADKQPASAVKVHKQGTYFEAALPEGWVVQPAGSTGLSDKEKKIYGITLSAPFDPADGEGPETRISAHYYAPDNLMDKTAAKYMRVHSSPEPAAGTPFPALPAVRDGRVGGLPAEVFGNVTSARGPERGMDAKPIRIWESFAVIPLKEGYYALRYTAPAGRYAAGLPAFEAFIASFKPLLK